MPNSQSELIRAHLVQRHTELRQKYVENFLGMGATCVASTGAMKLMVKRPSLHSLVALPAVVGILSGFGAAVGLVNAWEQHRQIGKTRN